IESETALDSNDKPKPVTKSRSRKTGLGGEHMRNLIAAFFAHSWQTAETTEEDVRVKNALIDQIPDIQPYLLAYLLIPTVENRKLEKLPRSEFGIPEDLKDWW